MRLVYVGGPFRSHSPWKVYQNVLAAERHAADVLQSSSLVPIVPHVLTRNLDPLQSDEYWLRATLAIMERCDALYIVPGWEDSIGTLGEIRRALELAKPVFFGRERLRLYGALVVHADRDEWIDLSPIARANAPWHPERLTDPQGNDACATVEEFRIEPDKFTMRFVLNWKGQRHADFGMIHWAIETVSILRSNGTLPATPAFLNLRIDGRIEELTRTKSGLE